MSEDEEAISTPVLPAPTDRLDDRERAKLHWRSRRGLLENDLYIENFFAQFGPELNWRQAQGMTVLMDLADNDLLDLVLARREPEGPLDTEEVREVLGMLRLSGGAARPRA